MKTKDPSLQIIFNSFWHTISYIELCSRNGIVFNPKKFHFSKDTVESAGFDITAVVFKPAERLIENIKNFPWLGYGLV